MDTCHLYNQRFSIMQRRATQVIFNGEILPSKYAPPPFIQNCCHSRTGENYWPIVFFYYTPPHLVAAESGDTSTGNTEVQGINNKTGAIHFCPFGGFGGAGAQIPGAYRQFEHFWDSFGGSRAPQKCSEAFLSLLLTPVTYWT